MKTIWPLIELPSTRSGRESYTNKYRKKKKNIIPNAINLQHSVSIHSMSSSSSFQTEPKHQPKNHNPTTTVSLVLLPEPHRSNSIYTEILSHPKVLRFLILSRLLRFYSHSRRPYSLQLGFYIVECCSLWRVGSALLIFCEIRNNFQTVGWNGFI